MSEARTRTAPYRDKRIHYLIRQGVSALALLIHISLLLDNGFFWWWLFAVFHGVIYALMLYRIPFFRQRSYYNLCLDGVMFGICIVLWGFNPYLVAIGVSSMNIISIAAGGVPFLLRCLGLMVLAALLTGWLSGFTYRADLPEATLLIASVGLLVFMTTVGARVFAINNRLRQTRNNLAQQSDELRRINTLAVAVNTHLDVDIIMGQVMLSLESKYPFEALYVVKFDEAHHCLEVYGIYGSMITPSEHAAFERFRFDIDRDRHSVFVQALIRRKVVYIPRIEAEMVRQSAQVDRDLYAIKPSVSLAYFPVYVKDVVVAGACFMNYEQPFDLTKEDLRIIQDYLVQVGTAVRNAGLFQELTAANEKAEQARRKAETSEEAKSRFLANMSHEIRTPMTAILGYTETLLEDQVDPQQRVEFLHHILRNGQHLVAMINDILDLSKIEAKRIEVENISCSLLEILCDIDAYMTIQCQRKGLDYRFHAEYPFPSSLQSDPTRLKQILLNLGNNAAKFTKQGAVALSVRFHDEQLQIAIRDTGVGVDEANQQRIFSAFHQADSSTTRLYGGTGLGLCISRNLAQLLGGDLALRSEKGKGSTFTLTLPVHAESAQFIHSEEAFQHYMAEVRDAKTYSGLPQLQGRVLVAEDHLDNQSLIRQLLEQTGLSVDMVNNGQAAVEAAQRGNYALILLDIQMPQLSGLDSAKRLQELGIQAPIVAFTANVMKHQIEEYEQLGFAGVLEKPIVRSQLYNTLKSKILIKGRSRGRVLIVEDNEVNQMILHRYITKAAEYAQITLANDGLEAVERVQKQDFDLILMDMEMPRMDGLAATRAIRERGYDIPIYIVSGNTDPEDVRRCLSAGASGHLVKPLNKKEIHDIITQVLNAPR